MITLLALFACGGGEQTQPEPKPEAKTEKAEPKHAGIFKALPKEPVAGQTPITEPLVTLGRQLYYDKRLSKNHDIACNSCHKLDAYGVDGEPTSPGHKGVRGGRNSPTTLNASFHLAQFWDGREPTVEAQAKGPVLNPVEMAMPDAGAVLVVLKSIPGYVDGFKAAFPDDADPVTYDNFGTAVGAFERGLITRGKFDAYLEGDAHALSDAEIAGLDAFVETGCVSCHSGMLLGGNSYQKLGAVKPYDTKDMGRFDLTKNDADKFMFKVPSLRNIAHTGPYLHDGSIATLPDMIRLMGEYQLGKELDDETVGKIETFLKALDGDLDAEYVKIPELPESGPDTPKPDPS
ncbi:MAG: c-type cytochrome [Alphaproteobacteria bacterium]|nr:c-type cytochrome [Alphaproteobacteria bacterium]